MIKRPYIGVVCFLFLQIIQTTSALEVIVPIKSEYKARHDYPLALLKFVLDKSGVEYHISYSDTGITTQSRQIDLLKQNRRINIVWCGTSANLESELVPIRFPIWRGLLGFRIFIINKNMQETFDNVYTLEDLQKYIGDQGIGWTDIQILERSGLMQQETRYDLIFAKINENRSDYFARGITEGFTEVEIRKEEFVNLTVERHLLLEYPFAGFFFTNKENPELAEALEKGFQESYADGSFLEFFYNYPVIRNVLDQANLENRVRIQISNPLVTEETLAIPDKYWHGREGQ